MALFRQTWALTKKNLIILARRQWFSTLIRALVLPIGYIVLISYVRYFFLPPSTYGFGDAEPILTPTDAFRSQSSRSRLVLINNNITSNQIDTAIDSLATLYRDAGADVYFANDEDSLGEYCRSSLLGTSRCYGAASFWSAPDQGTDENWDYTAFTDWGLGLRVNVDSDSGDAQTYAIPFIHAIDWAIANASDRDLPQDMMELPFTSETLQERRDDIQRLFMRALADYLGLVIFVSFGATPRLRTCWLTSSRSLCAASHITYQALWHANESWVCLF
jgi:ATP-binding cassette, subfamily A (ABC1), member 3